MLGQLLDRRYQVVQVLGAGGFGQTYIARDTRRPGNPVCVVKHLKPASGDPKMFDTAKRLFNSEAETLEHLGTHDQIPRLLAYFDENQEFYLVQEFIEGHTLSTELQPGQPWTENQVIDLLQEILGILEFVHQQGVIHRDIKPDNIIRRRRDNKLVLVDFGAVKQLRSPLLTTQGLSVVTVAIGTPGYMPTEQGRGKPRPNSDIYALGIIAIQALTGWTATELQEDPNTGEIIWQHLVPVSAGLAAIVTKMVDYHFKDRYQTATEVLQVLRQLSSSATPPQPVVASRLITPQSSIQPKTPPYYTPPQPTTSWQPTTPVAPHNPPPYQVIPQRSASRDLMPLFVGIGVSVVFVGVIAAGTQLVLTSFRSHAASTAHGLGQNCFAVITPNSNIRSEPTSHTRQNILETVTNETQLSVTGRKTKGGWVEVELPEAGSAWAHLEVIANESEMNSCLKAKGTPMQVVADATFITSHPDPSPKPQTDKPSPSINPPSNPDDDKPTPKDEGQQTLEKAKEKYQLGNLEAAISLLKSIPATSAVSKQAETTMRQWQQDWTKAEAKLNELQKALDAGRWDEVLKYQKGDFPEIHYWQDKLTSLMAAAIQKKWQPPNPTPSSSPTPIPKTTLSPPPQ